MVRVAMLADHPGFDEEIDGGVQAVTRYLCQSIAAISGVELHVIRMRRSSTHPAVIEGRNYALHSLPVARFGTGTAFMQDQINVNRLLDKIRPNVIHSQGAGYYGILAKRTRFPCVVTIHGIPSEEARFERRLQLRLRSQIQGSMGEYYCVRRASHTILVSSYIAEYYDGALKGKRYFIPNPVHAAFFNVARRPRGLRNILFAGRVTALKGVLDLVEAFALMADPLGSRLIIAGATPDKVYLKKVRDRISALGLQDKVDIRGSLNQGQLLSELAECACLALPSYQENAPMVIQEAMASGVPVVASDVGGISSQVEDGATGFLFAPGDRSTLAGLLQSVISDEILIDAFGKAARQKAEIGYQASLVARQTVEVYTEM